MERVLSISIICILAVLMVLQGGFFSEAACAVLISAAVVAVVILCWWWLAGRRSSSKPSGEHSSSDWSSILRTWFPLVCALLIAALFAVSSLAHGLSAESLRQCSPWLLAAIASVGVVILGSSERIWLLKGIAWLGVVSAVVGIALFADIPHLGGTVSAGRLNFLFQYANAAGAWFACVALICMRLHDARLSRCLAPSFVALLLTQSVGAILLFGCIMCVCIARKAIRAKDPDAWTELCALLVQILMATLVFACFRMSISIGVIVFLAVWVLFYELWPKACKRLMGKDAPRVVFWVAACMIVAALVALAFVMAPRLMQASGTFAERLAQMRDAFTLLVQNPVLGIGPDQWQVVYPSMQSAEYRSAVVHSGYLQLGLDAGVLAPLALLGMLAHALVRGGNVVKPALWLLALHSLIDFDLRFAFFVVLIFVFVSASDLSVEDGNQSGKVA